MAYIHTGCNGTRNRPSCCVANSESQIAMVPKCQEDYGLKVDKFLVLVYPINNN